ncbi:MAG TPA: hypothetical protein VLH09_13475, partial [Bryobacteraceae bacterium]|nr:hypothetical protein [Bryobacteraceae bacterium]
DLFNLQRDLPPIIVPFDHYPLWIEGVWRDDDGSVYAWYHHEANGGCAYKGLVTPQIGALVSRDGGRTFYDLGIVLASGDMPNCNARNGYFAGGHGDFSVILDRNREYFYFLFTNYGGPASSQGIALARMAFQDRANPSGTVYKHHQGGWNEPGLGGQVTPVLPAGVSWDQANTDSFWGPAVHWNTRLERFVVLLNRACCKAYWPQEGIYLSFLSDPADPGTWTGPARILAGSNIKVGAGYYPQVFGIGPGETDSLVGEVGRLFVKGVSKWQIVFSTEPPRETAAGLDPEQPDSASPPPLLLMSR